MSMLKLVLSDLHLADGHPLLDGFGERQQAAFTGLLRAAAPGGPLGAADDVELIINGDCFDFLATPPYVTPRSVEAPLTLEKLEKIIAAHHPFFEALREFLGHAGRHITFTAGNHDIDIMFKEVQERVRAELGPHAEGAALYFCPSLAYRPRPDVHIEHGNRFDFWNHRLEGLWNEQGEPLTERPREILLPAGSWYYQATDLYIGQRYPYFDHLDPGMSYTRRTALMCLLNPEIVREGVRRALTLLAEPREALAGLTPEEERVPAKVFERAMIDILAFMQQMQAQTRDWTPVPGWDDAQADNEAMQEYAMLHETLARENYLAGPPRSVHSTRSGPEYQETLLPAVAAVCTPMTSPQGDPITTGMRSILKSDPRLRYAIAGHTHKALISPLEGSEQAYLNSGGWPLRLAHPASGEVTPELVDWLRQPDWQHIPLRDVTRFTFVLLSATEDGPSSASLCVWEGGSQGSYHVLG